MAGKVLADAAGGPLVGADGKVPLSDISLPAVIQQWSAISTSYWRGASGSRTFNCRRVDDSGWRDPTYAELTIPLSAWGSRTFTSYYVSPPHPVICGYSRTLSYSYPNVTINWGDENNIYRFTPRLSGTSPYTGNAYSLPYKRMKRVSFDWSVVFDHGNTTASDTVFKFYYFIEDGSPAFTSPSGGNYNPYTTDAGWVLLASVSIPSGASIGQVLASGTVEYVSLGYARSLYIGTNTVDPTTPFALNVGVKLNIGNAANMFGRVVYNTAQ